MTLRTAQTIIINQLFLRQEGNRRARGLKATSDLRVPPAALARQAWRRLQHQGLIDSRGRLTLSGLAVAVALRARAKHSSPAVVPERKPASLSRTVLNPDGLSLAA
jgi:hypothetical protein